VPRNTLQIFLCTLVSLGLVALSGCRAAVERSTDRPADYYSRPLPPGQLALERVGVSQYPDFSAGLGNRESLLRAIDESLAYYAKPSSKRYFPYADITHDRAVASLRALRERIASGVSGSELGAVIRRDFEVHRSVGADGRGTVLFTGYCEPVYEGSRTRTPEFRYPLYRLPGDLVKDEEGHTLGRRAPDGRFLPYPTREQIDHGGFLEGRGLELVWLRHPLDAYVVHVQGSARIRLRDGTEMRVGYAGKNGRPYRSLGQKLVAEGAIAPEYLSLAGIRAYFRKRPETLERHLFHNESYVFFTETHDGPYGSLNARVTPMRTIATDKSVFPRGAMAFVETTLPSPTGGGLARRPYRGFALDQDTGGAIRSAGRCDLFIGTGPRAERVAGHTKSEGKLYYLFLRGDHEALTAAP